MRSPARTRFSAIEVAFYHLARGFHATGGRPRARPRMNLREDTTDPMTKVLAWLGYAALGVAAFLNAILGGTILVTGHLIGAFGVAGEHLHDDQLADSANHAALIAKLIAIGFGVMAATEYGAAHFLRRRIRTMFIPIACGLTVVGETAFSVWSGHFNALDAVIIACVAFATWVWWKLPRA